MGRCQWQTTCAAAAFQLTSRCEPTPYPYPYPYPYRQLCLCLPAVVPVQPVASVDVPSELCWALCQWWSAKASAHKAAAEAWLAQCVEPSSGQDRRASSRKFGWLRLVLHADTWLLSAHVKVRQSKSKSAAAPVQAIQLNFSNVAVTDLRPASVQRKVSQKSCNLRERLLHRHLKCKSSSKAG